MTQTRKISKLNTVVFRHPDGTPREVIFHETSVFRATLPDADGWRLITLAHGGWITSTTQARINQALGEIGLPFRVSRAGGVMRLYCGGTSEVRGTALGGVWRIWPVTAGGTTFKVR